MIRRPLGTNLLRKYRRTYRVVLSEGKQEHSDPIKLADFLLPTTPRFKQVRVYGIKYSIYPDARQSVNEDNSGATPTLVLATRNPIEPNPDPETATFEQLQNWTSAKIAAPLRPLHMYRKVPNSKTFYNGTPTTGDGFVPFSENIDTVWLRYYMAIPGMPDTQTAGYTVNITLYTKWRHYQDVDN